MTTTMTLCFLFTLLRPKGRTAEQGCVNAKLVTKKHNRKTVKIYTEYKKIEA